MELKIKVICEELPGAASAVSDKKIARRDIYLGVQRGEEVIEAVPATRRRVVFEPGFRVSPLPEGRTNFLGPFAKGTQAQRFFYLSWAVKDAEGGMTRIGRAKIHLSHLGWPEVEEAIRAGKQLTVKLRLTDKLGRPRCGSLKGEAINWQE